jgi:hypothetical protein
LDRALTVESEIRSLLGYPEVTQLVFMGRKYKIKANGLVPLLRYAQSGQGREIHQISEQEQSQIAMTAMYRLLEDCVTDFQAFGAEAFDGKAGMADVELMVRGLVEFYTCRKHWPAMRLMGYVRSNLEEMDGNLIKTSGRGVASLSAREACNLALALCLDGRDEEQREEFLVDLNYEGNADAEALALVRAMQAAREARDGG